MVVFENKTEIICIVHKKYNHGLLGVLKKRRAEFDKYFKLFSSFSCKIQTE
jgi:hypothetical protein